MRQKYNINIHRGRFLYLTEPENFWKNGTKKNEKNRHFLLKILLSIRTACLRIIHTLEMAQIDRIYNLLDSGQDQVISEFSKIKSNPST